MGIQDQSCTLELRKGKGERTEVEYSIPESPTRFLEVMGQRRCHASVESESKTNRSFSSAHPFIVTEMKPGIEFSIFSIPSRRT